VQIQFCGAVGQAVVRVGEASSVAGWDAARMDLGIVLKVAESS
jgi:hypothetical protein